MGRPPGAARTVPTAVLLLGLALGACGNETPTGMQDDAPLPTGEVARTTAVDSAVIAGGVFTARLEEPWVSQFGFTVTPIAVYARNVGTETLAGSYNVTPGCAYWLRLYWTSARLDAAFDPSRQENMICADPSADFEIEAGVEEELGNQIRLTAGVLGDNLPEGWYHPTVTIAPFGRFAELKVDSVHLVRP